MRAAGLIEARVAEAERLEAGRRSGRDRAGARAAEDTAEDAADHAAHDAADHTAFDAAFDAAFLASGIFLGLFLLFLGLGLLFLLLDLGVVLVDFGVDLGLLLNGLGVLWLHTTSGRWRRRWRWRRQGRHEGHLDRFLRVFLGARPVPDAEHQQPEVEGDGERGTGSELAPGHPRAIENGVEHRGRSSLSRPPCIDDLAAMCDSDAAP
jgi:hypothetical protein